MSAAPLDMMRNINIPYSDPIFYFSREIWIC